MKKFNLCLFFFCASSALLLGANLAVAGQSADLGDVVVHYNATPTDFFDPKVTKTLGIKRSKSRALLTVSVLKKHMGLSTEPMKASVEASAVNLNNQIKELTVREITEGGAVYYIAEFPVTNRETLDFSIDVTPVGGTQKTVKFRQQFFTD